MRDKKATYVCLLGISCKNVRNNTTTTTNNLGMP